MNDIPVQVISDAFGAALYRDLSAISYRRWTPAMKKDGIAPEDAPVEHRQPSARDVEMFVFPETWSSTALGYGGIGGQAFTDAYTVVVVCEQVGEACVYWGGSRLGIKLDTSKAENKERLSKALRDYDTSQLKGK